MPIDLSRLDEFDPMGVPTVQELLAEIDAWENGKGGIKEEEGEAGEEKLQDWQKTSLRPYVEVFRSHVNAVLRDEGAERKRGRQQEGGEGMEF